MPSKYQQNSVTSSKTRFTKAPMGEIEFSTMLSNPMHLTTFNAGDIVPIYCAEVLPHDTFEMDIDFVIRQATVAVPTMGQLVADYYAFFVPNRVVNKSWKNVMGENSAGAWANNSDIVLAPLMARTTGATTIPIGSVADYYGFPTQKPIPNVILNQCNDFKFRGYLAIYNEYFRDQNYQPPIPFSKLNIYDGFFESVNTNLSLNNIGVTSHIGIGMDSSGQYGGSALVKEFSGEGGQLNNGGITIANGARKLAWSALSKPLKANKMHDYFTSVLPSPQRGQRVVVGIGGDIRLNAYINESYDFDSGAMLSLKTRGGSFGVSTTLYDLKGQRKNTATPIDTLNVVSNISQDTGVLSETAGDVTGTNLFGDLSQSNISIGLDDIRTSAALQQYYEILGRGGGRYREFINSFFGLDVDNPFDDIPTFLGHFRRDLDLFQTAQTSASPSSATAGTPQGNLSAFGYTNKSGSMFHKTFVEHGYIHVFCVVRHKNIYSSMLSRDNFRLSALDFYSYPLANLTEQPVYTREINPYAIDPDGVFGYQECWAEYRMEPDRVSGQMRPQVAGSTLASQSLAYWSYADDFDSALQISDGEWLVSNTDAVVRRTTAVQDLDFPQFKGQFHFHIKKERPMPTYSVAGLDII